MRAVLGAVRYALEREVGPEALTRTVADLPDGEALERQVLVHIVRQFQTSEAAFRQALSNAKPEREETLQMTVAQEWIERGRAEGMRLGEARGEERGEARALTESLLTVLEARFGAIDASLRNRLEALDAQALRSLIRRAVVVTSAEELLNHSDSNH